MELERKRSMGESNKERMMWVGLGILLSVGILGGFASLLYAAMF